LPEDPPSQTVRLSPAAIEALEPPVVHRPEPEAAPTQPAKATRPRPDVQRAPATRFPAVAWHHAVSHGLPYAGRLDNGTQLPAVGHDWVTWNPIENAVPNDPDRLYANEHTIHRILAVLGAYRAANIRAPRVVIGDISFRHGGRMDDHVSHQNGLDVDVYYPRRDRTLREPTATGQIDRALAQDLLDRFVAAGAEKVFVGFSTGLRGPGGIVVPYPNHENHMHVRFRHPSG
jgi:murein endopeptidase